MDKFIDKISNCATEIFLLFTFISAIFTIGCFVQFLEEPIFIRALICGIVAFVVNLSFMIAAKMGKFQD